MSKKKETILAQEKDWERIDSAVVESENFILKYQKQLLIAVGLFVLLACGYIAYKQFYIKPKNQEAELAIFTGEKYFRMGNKDSVAIYGDGNGYIGFESIIEEYGSTKTGKLARLYAGICYGRMGKYEQALTYLNDFSSDDQILSHLVYGTIGDCLSNTGKMDEAAANYVKAAKAVDNESQSPVLYKKAGLVYKSLGQYDKVIEVFSIIKNQYSRSPLAAEAEKYIEESTILKENK